LTKWGKQWKKDHPSVQYSWVMCLRALEADPEATRIFLPEHKNPRLLNEAHKRKLATRLAGV
jgi:hypothetical protein